MHTTPAPSPAELADAQPGKYLTFQVGDEHFGIAVDRTREIIRASTITKVPQMPEHVKGVINLRGRIIPVIDLRIRFGIPNPSQHERTCVIVVQVTGARGTEGLMGLMVDAVEEVATLAVADIEPPPDLVARQTTGHITGMAKVKGTLQTLLDLDRLLAAD